jgi:hypothetical protein
MTVRRLGILQWVGLLAGAGAWAAAHVLGVGLTLATCNRGGEHWRIDSHPWEAALLATAALCVLVAGLASTLVLRETRNTTYEGAPPVGRIRFLAIAATAANVIFLVLLLLDLAGNLANTVCTQA